jgi:hypothetical protein
LILLNYQRGLEGDELVRGLRAATPDSAGMTAADKGPQKASVVKEWKSSPKRAA